ncbi:MAG TPA: cupin domain-containing protein [Solirubrobacteraceae bacterium]|nr:cupin domain-containing protein [Solirubrobacteraceae bacterium]
MPKVSKDSAAQHHNHGPVEEWSEDIDGYTVNFVSFGVDIDSTPLLKGLPDDLCQSPHWGYVLKGRVTYRFADREETHEAGDAFYVPAGHAQLVDAGTELVQFSPADELRPVSEAIMRNMQAMQAQGR